MMIENNNENSVVVFEFNANEYLRENVESLTIEECVNEVEANPYHVRVHKAKSIETLLNDNRLYVDCSYYRVFTITPSEIIFFNVFKINE